MSILRDMDRRRGLSSKLRVAALATLLTATAAAALTPGMRALYAARLAEVAAGRFATLPMSPEVNPATDPLMDTVVQWDRLRRDSGPTSFAEIAAFLRAHRGWPAEADTAPPRREADRRRRHSGGAARLFPRVSAAVGHCPFSPRRGAGGDRRCRRGRYRGPRRLDRWRPRLRQRGAAARGVRRRPDPGRPDRAPRPAAVAGRHRRGGANAAARPARRPRGRRRPPRAARAGLARRRSPRYPRHGAATPA